MQVFGITHTGMIRKDNQDSFFYEKYNDICLFMVADGLGGYNAGDVASQKCCEIISTNVREAIKKGANFDSLTSLIPVFIDTANLSIYEMSITDEKYSGMGTTVVIGIAEGKKVAVFNIGDSRAYRISDRLEQISIDHSFVQRLVELGEISNEQAQKHPRKNVILKALGMETAVEADRFDIDLEDNESVLLCSDGLYNFVDDHDMVKQMAKESITEACGELILLANMNGGGDNITVVVYRP